MKNIITLLLTIFALHVWCNDSIIKLNLEKGKSYIFESKLQHSHLDSNDEEVLESTSFRQYKFTVEEVTPEEVTFSSIITEAKNEKPDNFIRILEDYKFPTIFEDINSRSKTTAILNSVLLNVKLRFSINLENNTLKQINRPEMLEEIYSILKKKGYEKEIINKVIDFINTDSYVKSLSYYNNLFLFLNNSIIKDSGMLASPFLEETFEKKDGVFENGNKKPVDGNRHKRIKVNENLGIISSYYDISFQKPKYNWKRQRLGIIEREYRFVKTIDKQDIQFTFSCAIENPKSKTVTLLILNEAYGETWTMNYLKLDENNSASFCTSLPGRTLLAFSTKEISGLSRYGGNLYYAEPGDSLSLIIANDGIEVNGTHEEINQALNEIQNEKSLLTVGINHLSNSRGVIGMPHYENALEVSHHLSSHLDILEGNSGAKDFIKNELLARYYYNHFNYLVTCKWWSRDAYGVDETTGYKEAIEVVHNFDIHENYNEYGYFSRQLLSIYTQYHLSNLKRISDKSPLVKRTIFEEFYQAKLILGGRLYYNYMTERVIYSMQNYNVRNIFAAKFELAESLEIIDKLINQCYNNDLVRVLKTFRNSRMNWENDMFIPDLNLVKLNGETINFKDYIGEKPTVVYVTDEWSRYRYDFDREAKENPEVRYVMLCEGGDVSAWQDYNDRAEPVAEQLFLLKGDKTLKDDFIKSRLYLCYDKEGNLLKYDTKLSWATKLAKRSLEPPKKKELNKSQLQTIIIVLLAILTALIIGLLFWKWRVRQRFRKEEQNRKLKELELTAIRSQMNPHFLFNSLNSVQNLVQKNKGREAHLYLSDFAGLIRKVLNNSEKEEVSLSEELEMIKQYLSLEKLRFDFEFALKIDSEIDQHNTMVPSMLLQPFVENAIVHGLQNKEGHKRLSIEIKPQESSLKISVEDNGIGCIASKEIEGQKNGKGTKLIKERLKLLEEKQGEKYDLTVVDLEQGTRVEIFVPEEN